MDREQEEMQFLGLFGIYAESYKIIFRWRKIFSQITLALILPLSFIFLSHIEVSRLINSKINHTEIQLDRTPTSTKRYEKLSDVLSSELVTLWLFHFAYFTFVLIFSLLSTSAVVYTVASIYTSRDITFRRVMSVVPKVWKRLMVTFLCAFATFFAYFLAYIACEVVFALLLVMWFYTVGTYSLMIIYNIRFLYLVGLLYLSVVWHLANIVSVLEDLCGFRAMMKSKDLIKGKTWIAMFIFFKLNLSFGVIKYLFEHSVVHGESFSVIARFGYGTLCLLLLFMLYLFGLVIQTVIYFVCKSYHHENIDKSTLSDHLEVYLGEYMPLKAKDVQLEQVQV
ncbi:hypothetical protein NMG60_11032876 [Bertholletia excelsa]